jgi:hypothetical protein
MELAVAGRTLLTDSATLIAPEEKVAPTTATTPLFNTYETYYSDTYSISTVGTSTLYYPDATLVKLKCRDGLYWHSVYATTSCTSSAWDKPVVVDPKIAAIEKISAEAADKKAKELFLGLLTRDQREEFERTKFVTVRAPSGKIYRIKCTTAIANVYQMAERLSTEGVPQLVAVRRLCAHPPKFVNGGFMPNFDVFAAQLLMLKVMEEEIVKVAIEHQNDLKVAA